MILGVDHMCDEPLGGQPTPDQPFRRGVLENDAMYEQFKVDRSRKDHWAEYAAPAKIEVVYEPLPGMPADPRKLGAALVAATVLMLVSAGLRTLIRRSANDYARKTIEDLRCQHAALSREVKELRKRLQGEGIPETV